MTEPHAARLLARPRPLLRRVGEDARLRLLIWARGRRTPQRPHPLPADLIISLTSFPARFATLHRSLESLIDQSLIADRILLWIARDDAGALPRRVRALAAAERVDLRLTDDLGPYNKLVPTLEQYPGAFIATADDDIWYPPEWLATLCEAHDPKQPSVLCHRAHRLKSAADGGLAPYAAWSRAIQDEAGRHPSTDIMPTGVGGILYPPRLLHPDAIDRRLFMSLCPSADDLWFYWMGRRAGSTFRKVGPRFEELTWPGTQRAALARANVVNGANDRQAQNLVRLYGLPHLMPVRPVVRQEQG